MATPYLYDPNSPATLALIATDFDGNREAYEHDCTMKCECGCGERYTNSDAFDVEVRYGYGINIAEGCVQEWLTEWYDERREHSTYHARNGAVVG